MRHIVHISRYRDAMLDRKMALMGAGGQFEFTLVRPTPVRATLDAATPGIRRYAWLRLRGTNPHAAVYQSLSFALRGLDPDLIHAEEEPDSIAAFQITVARRLFARRAQLAIHTWQNVDRVKRWHVWTVLRHVLRETDAVFCASEEACALLRRFGFQGPTPEVPQYGVDLTTFGPRPERAPTDALVILYAGRLIPEKGIEDLIDAADRIETPCRLLIAGDGPHRSVLDAKARSSRLGDRLQFVGKVPPKELARIMADADVLVLPSRTTPVWKEQYGRVLVEAMACRVPIVGSNSGAIPDVVGDAGLIYKEGDARALADCLRTLAASPALRRDLGERGRARALARYSQEVIAAKTAAFYREVLGG